MGHSLLCIENLTIGCKQKNIITDFSLTLAPHEIVGIVGASGSGKSTVLLAALGIMHTDCQVRHGRILYKGQSIFDLNPEQLRKVRGTKMGMIFQDSKSSFCPVRTIGEQLYESLQQHEDVSKQAALTKAIAIMKKLHFQDYQRILSSYPFELSGGMNQRIGIVQALLLKPEIILADEPTANLDATVQMSVLRELKYLQEEEAAAILLVSHNIGVVAYMADRLVVMHEGKIVEVGSTSNILSNPQQEYTKKLIRALPRLKRGSI